MFHSMTTIIITVTILSILSASIILCKHPFYIIANTVEQLLSHKKMLLHFLALFMILLVNKFEQRIAKGLIKDDFTPAIHQWEGNIVYYLQHFFTNEILTYLLTFFYIIVFPTLMVTSFIIYLNINDSKSFYGFIYGLMLNYLIAIPFYLFFPVYEVWYFDSHIKFLIPEVFPNFETVYRPLSGLDNNFPSLHTSISITMALIALQSKHISYGKITFISSSIIVFSTLYLGIHWISDMTAGILLAVISSQTGLKLSAHTIGEEELSLQYRYIHK